MEQNPTTKKISHVRAEASISLRLIGTKETKKIVSAFEKYGDKNVLNLSEIRK